MKNRKTTKGFSLIELLIVIAIIGILSSVSYFAIQGAGDKAKNGRVTDDLLAISSALEEYKTDHKGLYPLPEQKGNRNILCFFEDATYSHGCAETDKAFFMQGWADSTLLTKRYLREVPMDPRTGNPYAYGVTTDGKYYQLAGIYKEDDETYTARTGGNLTPSLHLVSLIRSYNSPDFVVNKGKHLPYSPDKNEITGSLYNIKGTVKAGIPSTLKQITEEGYTLKKDDQIITDTNPASSADIYFSDGSITHLDSGTTLELADLTSKKNDSSGTSTSVKIKITAGKIWSKVTRLSSQSSFNVETSSAIAGVRGTEFGVSVNPDGSFTATVLSGEVGIYANKDLTVSPTHKLTVTTPFVLSEFSFDKTGAIKTAPLSPSTVSSMIQNYYKNIPLTSNMVPRILTVKYNSTNQGTITVRDINYYVEKLDITATRTVDATHLAVYSDSEGKTPVGTPLVLSGASVPYKLDSLPLSTSLYLRFEKRPGGTILASSPFTIPVTITSSASLTESQIYIPAAGPSAGSLTEFPEIVLTAQQIAAYRVGSKDPYTFDVGAEIKNYTGDISKILDYTVTADSTVCALRSPLSPSLSSLTFSIPFKVTAVSPGTCGITVSAKINGKKIEQKASVRIIEATQRLFPEYPEKGATVAGGNTTFSWDAPNASSNAVYDFYFDGVKKNTAFITGREFVYSVPTAAGSHSWKVVMTENSEESEGRDSQFTVSAAPAKANLADFEIKENKTGGKTILAKGQGTRTTIATDGAALAFGVEASSVPEGYTYEWNLYGFSSPSAKPSGGSFAAVPVLPAYNSSKDARISLIVRDKEGNRAGFMDKTVTISYFTLLTGISFKTPAQPKAAPGTSWIIPDLTATPSPAGPITPDKCTSLKAGNTDITGKTSYPVPLTATAPFTVTCTIGAGTYINGYAVGSTALSINTAVALSTTAQPPAVTVTANPASIYVDSPNTVAITATGGTGQITCSRTKGGGTLTGTQYSPKDTAIATRFSSSATESVTIECADTLQQKSSVTITVNYKPFSVSSNYMYSHAGASNVDWTTAKSACDNLTEGNYTDWSLPAKDKLADNTERQTWCSESNSSCLSMPDNAKTHWAAEEDILDTTKAYVAIFSKGSSAYTWLKNSTGINYGYRCARTPNP